MRWLSDEFKALNNDLLRTSLAAGEEIGEALASVKFGGSDPKAALALA
ncbi:MAG: hypothetical protein H0X43_10965 [Nitrosospira sp.]|nr:hypothetical protein [Nitrosospira sp.]